MNLHINLLPLHILLMLLSLTTDIFGQQPLNSGTNNQQPKAMTNFSGSETTQNGVPLPFPESEGKKITSQDGKTLWFSIQGHKFVLCCLNEKGEMIPVKNKTAKISYRQKLTPRHAKTTDSGGLQYRINSNGPVFRSNRTKTIGLVCDGSYLSSTKKIYPPYTFSYIKISWDGYDIESFPFTKKASVDDK